MEERESFQSVDVVVGGSRKVTGDWDLGPLIAHTLFATVFYSWGALRANDENHPRHDLLHIPLCQKRPPAYR